MLREKTMGNPLASYVTSVTAVKIYQNIQRDIPPHIVFDAMAQVAQRHQQSFVLPTSPAEYLQKHKEIENQLSRFINFLNRKSFFFEFLDEILIQLDNDGYRQYVDRFLSNAVIETIYDYKIRLSPLVAWGLSWNVFLDPSDINTQRDLLALSYANDWGPIIPSTVLQYLISGTLLYKQKIFPTAVALMTIAVEATLRDVLWANGGYTFTAGASKVDIYKYTKASVDVSPTGYNLIIVDPVTQTPQNLRTSFQGALPVEIEIRRSINQAKNRLDFVVKAPPNLIDHWSTSDVQQKGNPKIIGGLGEALDIARSTSVITNDDLQAPVDDTLKAIRNNLIHLSSNALGEELKNFAWKKPGGIFTLSDFVQDKELVFDLITEIPEFVNNQYLKLWKNKIHLP
jgi:hypothetical protein